MSTAEHAAIDAAVLRPAVVPVAAPRRRLALTAGCRAGARMLLVGGWLWASVAALPGLGGSALLCALCVTAALVQVAGLAAAVERSARAGAALAAAATVVCTLVTPAGQPRLVLSALFVTLAGSALAALAPLLAQR